MCVQALVRFESMQRMTVRDARGRIVRPDGSLGPVPPPPSASASAARNEKTDDEVKKEAKEASREGEKGEERRVVEHLVCENKMFYKDGWYVRDQVFEDVKAKFKDMSSMSL